MSNIACTKVRLLGSAWVCGRFGGRLLRFRCGLENDFLIGYYYSYCLASTSLSEVFEASLSGLKEGFNFSIPIMSSSKLL